MNFSILQFTTKTKLYNCICCPGLKLKDYHVHLKKCRELSRGPQEDVEPHVVESENIGSANTCDDEAYGDKDATYDDEAYGEGYSEWFGVDAGPIFTPNEILEMKEEGVEMEYYEKNAGVLVDDYEEAEEEVATAHDVEHDGYEEFDLQSFDPETSTAEEDLDSDEQDLPCM